MRAQPKNTTSQPAITLHPSPMFDPAGAGAYLGGEAHPINVLTLSDWRVKGIGPAYVKTGRLIRYQKADLDAYLASRRVSTTGV